METKIKKIAFVVSMFPVISETWLINQVANLMDHGIEVEIFSFRKGQASNISQRFYDYSMASRTHYLQTPRNFVKRFLLVIPKLLHLALVKPGSLYSVLNFKKYGQAAWSLRLLFWVEPFVGKKFDLVHCHFGLAADDFLDVKEILGSKQKIVTTFYGLDVSKVFNDYPGEDVYKRLKKESSAFIVMSDYMKKRIMAQGFDEKKIHILPIFGIDVNDYPFKERTIEPNEVVRMVTVGRFVEKKGYDDLLRAVAIVKEKTNKKFMCNIIGGGALESKLHTMTKELGIEDVVSYKGYMKIDDIIKYFLNMHLYLQPSKIASNGDQE